MGKCSSTSAGNRLTFFTSTIPLSVVSQTQCEPSSGLSARPLTPLLPYRQLMWRQWSRYVYSFCAGSWTPAHPSRWLHCYVNLVKGRINKWSWLQTTTLIKSYKSLLLDGRMEGGMVEWRTHLEEYTDIQLLDYCEMMFGRMSLTWFSLIFGFSSSVSIRRGRIRFLHLSDPIHGFCMPNIFPFTHPELYVNETMLGKPDQLAKVKAGIVLLNFVHKSTRC